MHNVGETIRITTLMETSGVKFGTSGARGLAADMTDRVCYAYALAFMQFLQNNGQIQEGGRVAIAGDYRPSSPRIMNAVAMAVCDVGCRPVNCGLIPTPTLALYAISEAIPGIMVTGSHIPDDRNGIKFYKPDGEILKADEQQLSALEVSLAERPFDSDGNALELCHLPKLVNPAAYRNYVERYLDFFPKECLAGRHIGIYEHSSVARDILKEVFNGLGAEITLLGRSETFIPVDTEAIRDEDVALAKQWAGQHTFDAIISADGDGDRPLISDESGNWLRGDVAGVLCARYLEAEYVATPVSCNSAVDKCGWFKQVERTRIGSPYVIDAMDRAVSSGRQNVIGYEANGGFLTANDIVLDGRTLKALPTRDAMIVPLTILLLASREGTTVSGLLERLPQRFTSSGRLKDFPTELSQSRLAALNSGDRTNSTPVTMKPMSVNDATNHASRLLVCALALRTSR